MHDLCRLDVLDGAQHQVVVLGARIGIAQAPDLPDQVAAVESQVRDQVVRIEQVQVPVALEIGVVAPALLVKLVLVGVEHPGIGVRRDRAHHVEEGVRGQQVVVVEEGDPVTRGRVQCAVGRGRNVAVR
ncbi:hypothetical protein D9M69_665250 [compost metagenome]